MLNRYCREHLIFFYAFCGTGITVGAQYATLTLSSCEWVGQSVGRSVSQSVLLKIGQSETRIVRGDHVCQRIGMKWAIFIEDLP